jgi:cytochrome c biogenesis protein CcmG/thiol:disulfide interchange protein DsbE
MLVPTHSTAQDYDAGLNAYDAGDFVTALRIFRPLAQQGDAGAQYMLGVMYLTGDGVSQDEAEAGHWLQLAAAQGVPEFTLPTVLPSVKLATPIAGYPRFDDEDLNVSTVKIVNFTASWCAPCVSEYPYLQELNKTVPTYGIFYKDKEANTMAILDDKPSTFTAAMQDGQGRLGFDWGIYGVPETYVIDENGVVVFRRVGPLSREVLETEILPFIQNPTVWTGRATVSVNSPE